MSGIMADDSLDKLRGARELFERDKETFFDTHEEGMRNLGDLEGQEQAERLGEAIEREQEAIRQTSESVDLQREAIKEQRNAPGSE